MKYSILALDLDGTLLTEAKEIALDSREAIQAYRAKGGKVILCSGRTPISTQWISETLGLSEPIISFNGAVIHDSSGNKLAKSNFKPDELQRFWDLCQFHHLYAHFYTEDTLLVPEITHWNNRWIKQNIPSFTQSEGDPSRCQLYRNRCRVEVVKDLKNYISEYRPEISKIAVFDDKSLLQFSQLVKVQIPDFEISSSSNYANLEISPKGVTKASSLIKLAKCLEVPLSQVTAIGDNFNDLEMLKSVGLGIAMGNAPDMVKKMADIVTDTNEQAGVAKAIRQYLLS